ncbi:MAG: hypothetical protein QXQ91_03725 [Nanopusillaceae archaeon]
MSEVNSYIITKEAWHDAITRSRRLQDEYGVSLDPALVLMVPDPLLIIIGQNERIFQTSGATEFIARPIKFMVENKNYIKVRYKNGVEAYVKVNGSTTQQRIKEVLRISRAYHYVVLNGGKWIVKKIYDIERDVEAAKKVINEYGTRKAVAMAMGLNEDGFKAYWPRAVTLINRGHYLELSQPGTGKTTFSYYISRMLGGTVMNEDPTEAFLVGDMRDNSFGVVYTSNIIIFDEIDKWKIRTVRTYNLLLTGLENCEWVRTAGKGMQINKCITFAAFGNTVPEDTSRSSIVKLLDEKLKIHAKPLVDRITVHAIEMPRFHVDYLGDMLKPAVVRGLSYLMTLDAENEFKEMQKQYDARTAWAMAVIKTLLTYVKEDMPTEDDIKAVYHFGAHAVSI